MKRLLNILIAVLLFSFNACKKEDKNTEVEYFQVEVLGQGLDCGELFLVRFEPGNEEDINRYLEQTNAYFPVFYAVGLPEEFKQDGLVLEITFRECSGDDIPGCTDWGPGYGIVCIESAVPVGLINEFS